MKIRSKLHVTLALYNPTRGTPSVLMLFKPLPWTSATWNLPHSQVWALQVSTYLHLLLPCFLGSYLFLIHLRYPTQPSDVNI